eukprot:scaffold12699_cov81-Amphora_coffeaeformis.AAC.1
MAPSVVLSRGNQESKASYSPLLDKGNPQKTSRRRGNSFLHQTLCMCHHPRLLVDRSPKRFKSSFSSRCWLVWFPSSRSKVGENALTGVWPSPEV